MNTIIGLVLAGGQSSRLGQDKTQVMHQGQTLLGRTADLVHQCCASVYISCRTPEVNTTSFPSLLDATDRIGPVGGIVTALRQFRQPVLAVACDLPWLHTEILGQLIQAHGLRSPETVATTWKQARTGILEPLVALYTPDALLFLEHGILNKHFTLNRLIPAHAWHTLIYPPEYDHFFFNMNTPQDLAKLTQNTQPPSER